jgi:hypothetical protein
MKNGVSKIRVHIKSIASLLLFIFCTLLLAEGLHSHINPQGSKVAVSKSSNAELLKLTQPFCEFCDYILHQSNRLLPSAFQFTAAPAREILITEFVQTQFVLTFNDLLLFSGNSPPRV